MPKGFFPASKLAAVKAPARLVPRCGSCGLFKTCLSPKMAPSGAGKRRVLIVSEAPGEDEDKQGIQLVGKTGTYLKDTLLELGVDMREDCWLTNSLICRPPENATPTAAQISHCRPNVAKALAEFKPDVVVPLGGVAVQSVLPLVHKETDVGGIAKWSGWRIPCQKINAWICPTFHPSYVVRSTDAKNPVPAMLFRQHLKAAMKLKGRPWAKVPNYSEQVQVILNPKKAALHIRTMIAFGGPVTFDYETTTMKPETEGAAILCCSVCSRGTDTIAYPWRGAAIEATRELLHSNVPKIAQNMKHEERWTKWFFGEGVRNWVWDTMVNFHIIDNRPDITGLEFQAFALLGVEAYKETFSSLLKAKDGQVNKAREEIDLHQLLVYNGLDSLHEYLIAEKQSEILGIPLHPKHRGA